MESGVLFIAYHNSYSSLEFSVSFLQDLDLDFLG